MHCTFRSWIAGVGLLSAVGFSPAQQFQAWNGAVSGDQADNGWYKPAPLRYPQLVPGRGLGWSLARYPEQVLPANVATNRLTGIGDRENERFFDIANRAYSREFVTGFSYSNPARRMPVVSVTYSRRAETFTGRLVARGLKPHFAYQIKLCGDHAADVAGFERIGRLGRWRLRGSPSTNFTDYDFSSARDKSAFESYILFDFLITDHNGDADKTFYLDSTLHVLFNHPKQGSPRANDSRPQRVVFSHTDSWVYANPKAEVAPQSVYAETEAGSNGQRRPEIGMAFLPPGAYRARLLLSEESFHGYGDGGFWAAVMACDVAFEVVRRPTPPPPVWQAGDLTGGRQVPLAGWTVHHASMTDASSHACRFTPDAGQQHPRVILDQALHLDPARRQIAAFDVRVDGMHDGYFLVGTDRQMLKAETFRLPAGGYYGWQPVEVALDAGPAVRDVYLGFLMSRENTSMSVRNLRIYDRRDAAETSGEPAEE